MKVRESKYFSCFFIKKKSFFIIELKEEAEEMSEKEYKKEILANIELMKKLRPKKYLYDFSLVYYNPAGPDIQQWLVENSFKVTNEFVEKQAIVSSSSLLMQVSARQTLDDDDSFFTQRRIFKNREEAEKWLFE